MRVELPRVMIAGLAGDSGKTFVSVGLLRAFAAEGLRTAPFKKGPDFIDAAWLGAAAGAPGRNLDTYLMPDEAIHRSLAGAARFADIAVVEGNRGLFDGLDARGSHSTAELAKRTGTPVLLLLNVRKMTRTAAALVAGCRAIDPDLPISGVILNNVGTARQERLIREAVAGATGLPVLGAVPRLPEENLPSRHLGLVTAMEHPNAREALEKIGAAVRENVDLAAIRKIASGAAPLAGGEERPDAPASGRTVRIGVFRDAAFTFYYPENLEALEAAGARLVPLSPLGDAALPDIDALYAGGGFPEVYAAGLSANEPFRAEVRRRVAAGMPVWAECGGLVYLSRSLSAGGVAFPMARCLPVDLEQRATPQGHGYVRARVDAENPFFGRGARLRGHEFHYTRPRGPLGGLRTVLEVERGEGIGRARDGIRVENAVATYTHLHALGTEDWAPAIVEAARSGGRRAFRETDGLGRVEAKGHHNRLEGERAR